MAYSELLFLSLSRSGLLSVSIFNWASGKTDKGEYFEHPIFLVVVAQSADLRLSFFHQLLIDFVAGVDSKSFVLNRA